MNLYNIRKQLNMGVPLSNINIKVTYYSRVSTANIKQHSSLKNQIDHFDELIKNNQNWEYIPGYIDDGISGTTDYKRDNFMKMIEDARNGKFDLIITKEISRFSRNTFDSIKYTRELLSCGVAVLFVNDNINTALPDSELRLTIMASMAQDEIRRLSERVKFGMNRAIKNGTILGNDMQYGYKKDKLTGNLAIIEEEANIIRRLYEMYAIDKLSISKIAKVFNSENIKTRQDKKWCCSTLTRMIKNTKYKGYYCGKKSEVIDFMTKKVIKFPKKDWVIYEDKTRIPPIVDQNLWNKANKRLESRSKSFGKEYHNSKIMYQNRYLFSAKIYCANDNEVFHRRMSQNNINWICSKYLNEGKKACESPFIRESELLFILEDIFKILEIDLEKIVQFLFDIYQNSDKDINLDNKNIELKREKNKILAKKEKLLELNIEGNLTNNEFKIRNNVCNRELNKINEQLTLLAKMQNNYTNGKENGAKVRQILYQKIMTKNLKEKLIELLLEKIVVEKINNNKEKLELNIFFNINKDFIPKEKIKKREVIMQKAYEFKRGYDTSGTRRYIVKYQVNCYASNILHI